ncbi:hypothetical protein IEG05_19695 [Pseudomonas kunmingensis]|uniref:hypothetical protein n=1 Tax=Stutzerimonas kunmingensis TaxID=1211807 RepID=UPI0017465505|nr:hypothetical protein [Stutzerimonas kunmingensis]MBD3877432.1 hypothetical protein [Stutzerimonas kunmingensis]
MALVLPEHRSTAAAEAAAVAVAEMADHLPRRPGQTFQAEQVNQRRSTHSPRGSRPIALSAGLAELVAQLLLGEMMPEQAEGVVVADQVDQVAVAVAELAVAVAALALAAGRWAPGG